MRQDGRLINRRNTEIYFVTIRKSSNSNKMMLLLLFEYIGYNRRAAYT